jgi:hypothetical protein
MPQPSVSEPTHRVVITTIRQWAHAFGPAWVPVVSTALLYFLSMAGCAEEPQCPQGTSGSPCQLIDELGGPPELPGAVSTVSDASSGMADAGDPQETLNNTDDDSTSAADAAMPDTGDGGSSPTNISDPDTSLDGAHAHWQDVGTPREVSMVTDHLTERQQPRGNINA